MVDRTNSQSKYCTLICKHACNQVFSHIFFYICILDVPMDHLMFKRSDEVNMCDHMEAFECIFIHIPSPCSYQSTLYSKPLLMFYDFDILKLIDFQNITLFLNSSQCLPIDSFIAYLNICYWEDIMNFQIYKDLIWLWKGLHSLYWKSLGILFCLNCLIWQGIKL